MPKKAVVKKNYPKKKAALLIPFILMVVKMMTDNKYFPKPKVALDALTEAALKLQDAFMERKTGKMPGKYINWRWQTRHRSLMPRQIM